MSSTPAPANTISLGEQLFRYRDYTPVPLIILLVFLARPTPWSVTLGLLTVAVGELIRLYSVAFIGSISRTRKDHTGARLITEGPFGLVRNPLYVGNFFITLGVAIFAGRWQMIALTAAGFTFQYYYIVAYEESILSGRFGEPYDGYRRDVPAWLPKQWPALEAVEWPTTFSPAIRSERQTLGAIAAVVLLILLFS